MHKASCRWLWRPSWPRLAVRAIWSCWTLSRSWRVAVAAPALPVSGARAAAHLGDTQIQDAWLAQAREIADHVDGESHRQREIRARDQERLGGHRRVDHEIAVGHA